MDPLAQHLPAPYIVLLVVWVLPIWGRRVLAFLRDLDAYRAERSRRREPRSRPDAGAGTRRRAPPRATIRAWIPLPRRWCA